ncbi:hypothetical protein [Corynebacterium flavescens]|uniref:hypothetical protein n=1 Tax=Corynebacterium flavescens TaxID=28028 RepID=UPI0028992E07|nr:hypothetical protein [Corynebacterium flavescens]
MTHRTWFTESTSGDTVNAAATRAGIVQRTLDRQLGRNEITAENVIKLAVAYGIHPVRALVDTGYLDEKYARAVDPASAIRMVTEDELADEVLRRMTIGVKTDALVTPADELAARRLETATPDVRGDEYDDGTVRDFDYDEPHAADSSPDEQEEREKRGEGLID